MATSAFNHVVFQPILAAYETALSTGSIGLLGSAELYEMFIEFLESVEDFKRHDELSGNMMYLGSFWEVRRKLGSLHGIDDNPDSYFVPPR